MLPALGLVTTQSSPTPPHPCRHGPSHGKQGRIPSHGPCFSFPGNQKRKVMQKEGFRTGVYQAFSCLMLQTYTSQDSQKTLTKLQSKGTSVSGPQNCIRHPALEFNAFIAEHSKRWNLHPISFFFSNLLQ